MSLEGATNIDDLPTNNGGNNSGNITMNINEVQGQNTQSQQHMSQQTAPQQLQQQTSGQNTIMTSPPQYNPNVQPSQNTNVQQNIGSNLSQDDITKIISGLQNASSQNMTSLPSRDVPMNTYPITNDPSVQPNYIPQPSTNTDYIKQQENMETLLEKHRLKEKHTKQVDDLYDTIQTPILIMLIFFIFQLPFVNKTLFNYLPNLFIKDGHLSFGGYTFKTILFGFLFIGITKGIHYLSDF
jgi:hypothetical protein